MLRWIFRGVISLLVATFAFHVLAHMYERDTAAESPPTQGRLVPTSMGAVYVEEAGPADGPAVLLLHGSIGWSGLWRPTLAALAEDGYHAYAFDMAPMGFSERDPSRGYARQTQADRIIAPMPFTLATWNINSVRLREGLVARLLADEAPDVLCLQECKTRSRSSRSRQFQALGYRHMVARGQKGYNGVAILSKLPMMDAGDRDFAQLGHARHVAARLENGVTIHNCYVPAGGDIPTAR
jgi:pimeloyl-ACP methyl ester carboxylesterase